MWLIWHLINETTFHDSGDVISLVDSDYDEDWDWTNVLSGEIVNPIDSQTEEKVQLDSID